MTSEQEFLLDLIRSDLVGSMGFPMPERVDWDLLIEEANRQMVPVIASDGLQKLYDAGVYSVSGDREERRKKARWFSKTISYEHRYAEQLATAEKLESWFSEAGLRTVVLKGFTVSECYPVPSHRYSADFDCFLLKDGEHLQASELGNRVVEEHGLTVDRGFYKNSVFTIGELTVENHQYCTPFRGNDRLRRFERLLEEMIVEGPLTRVEGTDLLAPPPLASALFLTEHAYSHFLHEGLNLRHFLDWSMFRRKHVSDVDWTAFRRYVDEFGFGRFHDAFEHVGEYILGNRTSLTADEQRMMDSVWAGLNGHDTENGLIGRLQLVRNTLRSGWKYRCFAPISMPKALWIQVRGVLFDRKPTI